MQGKQKMTKSPQKRIDLRAVGIYAGVCEKKEQQQVNPEVHCMPFGADCQLLSFPRNVSKAGKGARKR